jgi:hypothetical protein
MGNPRSRRKLVAVREASADGPVPPDRLRVFKRTMKRRTRQRRIGFAFSARHMIVTPAKAHSCPGTVRRAGFSHLTGCGFASGPRRSNSTATHRTVFSARHIIVIPAQAGIQVDLGSSRSEPAQAQGGSRLAPGRRARRATHVRRGRTIKPESPESSRRTPGSILILPGLRAVRSTSRWIPAFAGMTVVSFTAMTSKMRHPSARRGACSEP